MKGTSRHFSSRLKRVAQLNMESNSVFMYFGHRSRLNWLLLCIVTSLSMTTVFGGSSSEIFDSVAPAPEPYVYNNYRRLQKQDAVHYLELNSVSLGPTRQREFGLCSNTTEDYVPCYGVPQYLLDEFDYDDEFDRRCCEVMREEDRCLVPPPKDYKIPVRWPAGRDLIWSGNVKIDEKRFISSRGMNRWSSVAPGENQVAFDLDGAKDYSHKIAEKMGLRSDSEFLQAGVRSVLDIGCQFSSFGAHLTSLKVMSICIAEYEGSSSSVQLALERGLPAMIANFTTRQLPYPSLSFDMIHCSQCGISWNKIGKNFLIEIDRLLKPGGYFVLPSPRSRIAMSWKARNMLNMMEELELCWKLQGRLSEPFIWRKSVDANCYASGERGSMPLCEMKDDIQTYYKPLTSCLIGPNSKRWIAVQNCSSSKLNPAYMEEVHGLKPDDFQNELTKWGSVLKNYWSLLTPLIFSDHPKRLGDEDPLPPFNLIRNVMDMNAHYGGLNAALLEEGKLVWVMNVNPVGSPNTLPLILDQGFAGVFHDWCEPFPTYPRTYDMLHAKGLLSLINSERCSMTALLLEMDRILRPEGWVVFHDTAEAIETARMITTQMRWDARVIDLQNGSEQQLLVCQKPFLKR